VLCACLSVLLQQARTVAAVSMIIYSLIATLIMIALPIMISIAVMIANY
jgi:hypothetical protein